MSLQIVRWKRFFDPTQTVGFKIAQTAECLGDGPLHARSQDIDDQFSIGSDNFTDSAHQIKVAMAVETEYQIGPTPPAPLDVVVTMVAKETELVERPVEVVHVEVNRGHGVHAVLQLPTHQATHRLIHKFAFKVP